MTPKGKAIMTIKNPVSEQAGRQGRESELVYPSDPGTQVGTQAKKWGVGAAEKTYEVNGFDPQSRDDQLSYTPGRIAKNLFNLYENNEFEVFAYYSDWSIGDPRYGEGPDSPAPIDYSVGGRGTDIMRLRGKSGVFDKIVVGFAAIVGDRGVNRTIINRGVIQFGLYPAFSGNIANPTPEDMARAESNAAGTATFIDPWNDVAAFINCGFDGWVSNDYVDLYNPAKAQGVLGALLKLHQADPALKVSLSLGGWSMSQAFYYIARDDQKRARLVKTIGNMFRKFAMFSEIDMDWEYPAAAGNMPGAGDNWEGNLYDDEDPVYFAKLISEVKAEMVAIGRPEEISIATIANVEKLDKANIPLLIQAGVTGINVMAYDFFGTPWAEKLQHHTNLKRSHPVEEENSADAAVQFLLSKNVPSKMIYIGYAGYSRNAQRAEITSISPLEGTYDARQGTDPTGSFESGVTEWPDTLYNYLDLEGRTDLNGFVLCTDEVADADFLYSKKSKVFISLDTPRTVKAKAEYVRQHNLGGMFIWMGDHDNGLLTNAAREGLGCKVKQSVVDMTPFYYKGQTKPQH
jgi:chitinase